MKRMWFISLLVILAILVSSMPVVAAAPEDNQGKGPIDKITFVHYPKQAGAVPGGGAAALTGVLCPDYKYQGIRWAGNNVDYYLNTKAAPSGASMALKDSFATWQKAGKLAFNFIRDTELLAGSPDNMNVVSWGSISSSNAIAVTYIWYYRFSKEIVECDTVMNSALPWSCTNAGQPVDLSGPATPLASRYADPKPSGDSNAYDIRNIMTHEAGHWILLNDLYNNRDSALTMYGYGSKGEIQKDTLGYGDELGLEKAYGY